MDLKLSIEYRTAWGESLEICIGGKCIPLNYNAGGIWTGEVKNVHDGEEYCYHVVRDSSVIREEWRAHRLVLPTASVETLVLSDSWNDRPEDAPFYSSAFVNGIFGRKAKSPRKISKTSNVLLKVSMPVLRRNEVLAIAGCGGQLGEWDKVLAFDDACFPEHVLQLKVKDAFVFKFLIADAKTLEPIQWENSNNRYFVEVPHKGEAACVANFRPEFDNRRWKGAGTAIPVFSLKSEESFGVGEFYDLKKMVDWAVLTGQSVIQILPINDTTMTGTWTDSYPYNANSTFALHPQFVNLPAAGVSVTKSYKALRDELNALDRIDYERVNNAKIQLLKKAFDKTFAKLSQTESYKTFMEKNSEWLLPYASFCSLRDEYGTPDFSKWGKMKTFSKVKNTKYVETHKNIVDFWCFVQYHLDKQLSEVCAYAKSQGVVLKGDLPIGISRTSVDAWQYPELFHMDSQAGAPPDAFSADGQNWGFPTYNWEKMSEDGYAWWKARMGKMSEYFDVYRIDHILGFFRIWEIPVGCESGLDGHFNPALPYAAQEIRDKGFNPQDTGLFIEDPRKQGFYHPRIGARNSQSYNNLDWIQKPAFDNLYNDFFYHRHNQFWKETALKKLPALIDSTKMLACGEDLGMIPATVPEVMEDLKILSLEIQRMPKSEELTFDNPANYPYRCVCTTSTHDMNPIRAWWEEDRAMTERFFREILGFEGTAPQFCEPWVCRRILEQHVYSPAMLTILPLQDWLSMDSEVRLEGVKWQECDGERINVPANPRHYWRYRMHMTLEELLTRNEFNAHLRDLITESGRA